MDLSDSLRTIIKAVVAVVCFVGLLGVGFYVMGLFSG